MILEYNNNNDNLNNNNNNNNNDNNNNNNNNIYLFILYSFGIFHSSTHPSLPNIETVILEAYKGIQGIPRTDSGEFPHCILFMGFKQCNSKLKIVYK